MLCPACKDVSLSMTDRQGIEIDFCPQCRGIWLDRGELDKIIERSAANEKKWFRDDDDDDDRYKPEYTEHKKRKKSFLGDLLDIG